MDIYLAKDNLIFQTFETTGSEPQAIRARTHFCRDVDELEVSEILTVAVFVPHEENMTIEHIRLQARERARQLLKDALAAIDQE